MKLHDYQEYAVKFIEEHKIAALLLDMGLGKTITTLQLSTISYMTCLKSEKF